MRPSPGSPHQTTGSDPRHACASRRRSRRGHEGLLIAGVVAVIALGGIAGGALALAAKGALTFDVGVGRRVRPLGPLVVEIDAPRDLVFDTLSAPYLRELPRALRAKLDIVERGSDMVLAAHFTPIAGSVATTLEIVRFEPPERVSFRLVRGPVPHVVEEFALEENGEGTRFRYSGELGTDFWTLGRLWGDVVARRWEAAVEESVAAVKTEAERRAKRR